MIFGRIVCFFKGHKRGKLVGEQSGPPSVHDPLGQRTALKIFACPRCGNQTRYKVKPNGQSVGAPGDQL